MNDDTTPHDPVQERMGRIRAELDNPFTPLATAEIERLLADLDALYTFTESMLSLADWQQQPAPEAVSGENIRRAARKHLGGIT